jgi:hypothetical protein
MTDDPKPQLDAEPVDDDELEQQEGKLLEDREAMTILPIDPTAPSKFLPIVE